MTIPTTAEAALTAALAAYRAANVQVARLSLWLYADEVRDAFHNAVSFSLEWSDQHDGLMLREVLLPPDAPAADHDDAAEWCDDTGLPSNLDEGNQSTWLPFAAPEDNGYDGIRRNVFRFDIEAILATDPTTTTED